MHLDKVTSYSSSVESLFQVIFLALLCPFISAANVKDKVAEFLRKPVSFPVSDLFKLIVSSTFCRVPREPFTPSITNWTPQKMALRIFRIWDRFMWLSSRTSSLSEETSRIGTTNCLKTAREAASRSWRRMCITSAMTITFWCTRT